MMLAETAVLREQPPMTNRGVYPLAGWTDSAVDYLRASVGSSVELLLVTFEQRLAETGRAVTRTVAPKVKHYAQHIALTDVRGAAVVDVFWGSADPRPNIEVKGSNSPAIIPIVRQFQHAPSRIDVKRDGAGPLLFRSLVEFGLTFAKARGLTVDHIQHYDDDKGDTLYIGSRKSEKFIRIYQPGLKRAQAECRTGDNISTDERNSVRVELEFNPQKRRAKLAAASLSPDELWGVSPWIADFAREVFAMNVQPATVSERRESNRNRALRFMSQQYRAHLQDLLSECNGDLSMFAETILVYGDIPYKN
jgi:Replication initiation factor